MTTLMVMLLNIGGGDGFGSMLFTLSPLLLLISLIAGLVGLFTGKWRTRWSALMGIVVGLAGGLAIVAYGVSNI